MTGQHHLNYRDRNLRNRSFKGLDLKRADFSGSDIRGCDFSYALLVGANFQRVRTGVTLRKVLVFTIVAVIIAFLTGSAVTSTVFSSLGEPVGGKSWPYIVALFVSLCLSGIGAVRISIPPKYGQVLFVFSGVASGAFLGFYYAGIAANKNPSVAVLGAVVGGLLMAFACLRFPRGLVAVAVTSAAAITGYGLAFWLWAVAIAFLTAQKLILGILLTALSLIFIGLTISSLFLAFKEIKKSAGTSFRNADLTDAVFDNVKLGDTDFTGAIGYVRAEVAREE